MERRSIFSNLSPLDHRYYLANREVFDALGAYLSEEAAILSCLRVEVALLSALVRRDERFRGRESLLKELEGIPERISVEEIYEEEGRTHHNIRALVNVLGRQVPVEIRPLVHLGATSADILDTARAVRLRGAVIDVILPLLIGVERRLITLAAEEADTPQIGRTHGQHAVPVTFGYAMCEYVSRLGGSIERIEACARDLRGKLSGAVGAYNATALIVDSPEELERDFLASQGLEASGHSTQIVEPEHLLRLVQEINTCFGIVANLADDLRHLQRSEIKEVREAFAGSQVGSSTMPQKRNPWNSEHVKSLWKAFAPRVMTLYLDQISEHQRDLTNSASTRFVTEYLAGFTAAVHRMRKVLGDLGVDRARMLKNLRSGGDLVMAEPLYILLAVAGEPDAHEVVRKLTLEAERRSCCLSEVVLEHGDVCERLAGVLHARLGVSVEDFLAHPEAYTGRAAARAKRIAEHYTRRMDELEGRIAQGARPGGRA